MVLGRETGTETEEDSIWPRDVSERVAETPVWEMEGNEASEGGSVNETTVSPEGGKLTGKGEEGCGEDPRRTMREAEESVVRVEGDVSARRWTVSPGPYPPSLLPSLVVVEEEEEEEEEEVVVVESERETGKEGRREVMMVMFRSAKEGGWRRV